MGGEDRLRGSVLGLGSALLFGLGAPVSKLLLPRTQPIMLAALLYLGAGAAFLVARPRRSEAPLTRADAPVLGALRGGGESRSLFRARSVASADRGLRRRPGARCRQLRCEPAPLSWSPARARRRAAGRAVRGGPVRRSRGGDPAPR